MPSFKKDTHFWGFAPISPQAKKKFVPGHLKQAGKPLLVRALSTQTLNEALSVPKPSLLQTLKKQAHGTPPKNWGLYAPKARNTKSKTETFYTFYLMFKIGRAS